MTSYKDSQSLIEGQKQHSKETSKLFRMKKYEGMTLEQTSHCKKFTKLCKEMDWDRDIASMILECTPGDILNIEKGITPIKEEWAKSLLIKKGIRLSTLRLDKEVDNLKKARQSKYTEIWESNKTLCTAIRKSLISLPTNNYIDGLHFEFLGRGLKAFRAMTGDSQYSLADKIAQHCEKGSSCTDRIFWHKIETKNYISKEGALAFYKTYGITIIDAITPFINYLRRQGIDPYFDFIKAKYVLDTLESKV